MNGLTVFGAIAVTAMLVFYAAEGRSPAYVLAFAAACLMASLYGFLQGAWPFGICLLYTSPSPRDRQKSRMPSSA